METCGFTTSLSNEEVVLPKYENDKKNDDRILLVQIIEMRYLAIV